MFLIALPVCRTVHLLSVSLYEALKALVLATGAMLFQSTGFDFVLVSETY